MIAVIGAGLTGLSTAWHLSPGRDCPVFEQQDQIGGLCRSPVVDGFTFDYTGHLLHLRDSYTRDMVGRLLHGNLREIERNATIYCMQHYLPFPFQANLHGLPFDARLECLEGFIAAAGRKRTGRKPESFQSWVTGTFGRGIARHFFIPYNEKLFCKSLRSITCDWVSWSVPKPSLREVLKGALGSANTGMGYNASFWYPERGGIQKLPEALSRKVKAIELGRRLVSVQLKKRALIFHDGTQLQYEKLISTMPLPKLLGMIEGLPPRFTNAGRHLTSAAVHNINIGINRPGVMPYHWIYFPEAEFPFYRIGCYSNFTPYMAPAKTSSLYIEIAARPDAAPDYAQLRETSLEGLRRCGILRRGDRIVAEQYNRIDSGYVLFDRFRQQNLPGLLAWLKKNSIISAGRYGAWTYCSMEDNILEGRRLAEAFA
jgi:protoporphyrinogen oxidase